jgi:hypothetical protein
MRIFGIETAPIERQIGDVQKRFPSPGFEWYPYRSLTNLQHLNRLLGKAEERVLESARLGGVLDIGSGDGDLSFLFEAAGCRVDAVDHPIPNHNHMQGIRLLARELNSKIGIHEIDLDSQFSVPSERYGLTVFLGILYHLKNPYFALEQIARHSDYCLLSTRIARRLPGGAPIPEGQPLVYLLDSLELNQDDSNFWIFSDAGLRRILKRTHWEVVEWMTIGDTTASDPVSLDHDERAFCLLRSHHSLAHAELLEGWHQAERSGWRWTERRFSARFKQMGNTRTKLALGVYVPPEILERVGPLTLIVGINGQTVTPVLFESSGEHHVVRSLEGAKGDIQVEFELDKCLSASPDDTRELGIIVASIELE